MRQDDAALLQHHHGGGHHHLHHDDDHHQDADAAADEVVVVTLVNADAGAGKTTTMLPTTTMIVTWSGRSRWSCDLEMLCNAQYIYTVTKGDPTDDAASAQCDISPASEGRGRDAWRTDLKLALTPLIYYTNHKCGRIRY